MSLQQFLDIARYFPFLKGVYDVGPQLYAFGHDFGNGPLEQHIFQIDKDFPLFRQNKMACRRDDFFKKYYVTNDFPEAAAEHVARFIAERLAWEWPTYFSLQQGHSSDAAWEFSSRLTNESLVFSDTFSLLEQESTASPPYASAIDALLSQVPEDLAVTIANGPHDHLAALHVCSPSHWAPEAKIGLNFAAVHGPVAGFEKTARTSSALVQAMIHKGPYVRFVWSFVTDTRLNHHPMPPAGENPQHWRGRAFAPQASGSVSGTAPFFLRIERQVTWGLPGVNASLFFIRVSFLDGRDIRRQPEHRNALLATLHSMSAESLHYKGLTENYEALCQWLKETD